MAVLAAIVVSACGGSGSGVPTRIPGTPSASQVPHLAQSSLRNAAAPPARYGAALAFDPASKALILFGGATVSTPAHPPASALLDDTWAWDGHTWQQLHPATSPPALYGAALVQDPTSGHLLLVGGSGELDANGLPVQQGTWSWDGQTWARTGDNPIQMPFSAVGADPVHRQVLFSGADTGYLATCGGRITCPVIGQLNKPGAFVWNGRSWSTAQGSAPQWSNAGTAFDPLTGQLLSAAGSVNSGLQSTYGWDGKRWRLISQSEGANGVADADYPAGPCDAATDADAGTVVMVRTFSTNGAATGATWTFDGTTWNRATQARAALPAIPQLTVADDPVAGAVVMVYPQASGTELMRIWNGSDWAAIP